MASERIPGHELEWEILGYQAMSKTEHSIHTRRILALLIELRELRRVIDGAWQPIETAPTDQNGYVVLYGPDEGVMIGHHNSGKYWFMGEDSWCEPTHWQPLPSPPSLAPEDALRGGRGGEKAT